ncbi:methyltransferase [Rosenbergiella sp. S61]|uniref:Methyltransferase n=1 Tax=Rosenbergiella gaditana TaxID=2726987 RepID=A0ABS5STA0_9GAMM|nr:methyltransferase [Rosenbergiella gaditana]MBT0723266.1 methyltransferase [Rosenbergiella gaditana]
MLASAINMFRSKAGFVQQFIRNPRAIGSITPSSHILCETMAQCADWQKVTRAAELGAGDGVLTRVLLQHLAQNASLDVFEISPSLVKKLRQIQDERMSIHSHSAEHLSGHYDVIFSGLPLLSLPAKIRHAILEKVHETLAPGGVFIQFQYTSLTQPELSRYFIWERQRVLKNVPPAWVYRCQHNWSDKTLG